MAHQKMIWAFFDEPDRFAEAARRLGAEGYPFTAHAPVMTAELARALPEFASPVRWFALAGSLVGGVGGLWLSIWSASQWGRITGGKPVVSIPPFVVIAFEFTILFGALATVLGFVLLARLPRRTPSVEYRPSLSVDRFALKVLCSQSDGPRVEGLLKEAGAEEVHADAA